MHVVARSHVPFCCGWSEPVCNVVFVCWFDERRWFVIEVFVVEMTMRPLQVGACRRLRAGLELSNAITSSLSVRRNQAKWYVNVTTLPLTVCAF